MNIEKWGCNKCGSPCRVEIHYDSKGPAGDLERFRKRCVAGTKDFPEDNLPEWQYLGTKKDETQAPKAPAAENLRYIKQIALAKFTSYQVGLEKAGEYKRQHEWNSLQHAWESAIESMDAILKEHTL